MDYQLIISLVTFLCLSTTTTTILSDRSSESNQQIDLTNQHLKSSTLTDFNSNENNKLLTRTRRSDRFASQNNPRDSERFTAFSLLPSAANKSVFICPEKFGYFPDKRDCTKYFVCVFGEPLHESCTGGLYFSAELQTCDWPRNVLCPNEMIKNYEKSVFSTVDIGNGDDAYDYDVRLISSKPGNGTQSDNRLFNDDYPSNKEVSDYSIITRNLTRTINDGGRNSIESETNSRDSLPGELIRNQNDNNDDIDLPRSTTVPPSSPSVYYSSGGDGIISGNLATDKSPLFDPLLDYGNSAADNAKYTERHGNKVNREFDPQGPNDAEAIPPLVDSKGGIHFSDGVGGTFGIVNQLPGLLTPGVSDHSINVFIRPLTSDSDKDTSNSRSRESRILRENEDSPRVDSDTGFEYIPVITPEKLILGPSKSPFDYESRSEAAPSRGRSASRPRGESLSGLTLGDLGKSVNDPETDFQNLKKTNNSNPQSIETSNEKKDLSSSEEKLPLGQIFRKEGNEEFVLVPFKFTEGRRRNRGRVRVVPKIVPKNKLKDSGRLKASSSSGAYFDAKSDGSVIIRSKKITESPKDRPAENKYSENFSKLPGYSTTPSSSPTLFLPLSTPTPTSPSGHSVLTSRSSRPNFNTDDLPFPLDTGDGEATYNVQWNKGRIEIPELDHRSGFLSSILSDNKQILSPHLEGNHVTSNNGEDRPQYLNEERPVDRNNRPNRVNQPSPTSQSSSFGTTAPNRGRSEPFIGKILRTLGPQTIYSRESLPTIDRRPEVISRPKVEDELPWPGSDKIGIDYVIEGYTPKEKISDLRSIQRQQSTPLPTSTAPSIIITTPKTISTTALPVALTAASVTTIGPRTRATPSRKSRPTNKRLVVKHRSTVPPKQPTRPKSVYPTPKPLTSAAKCDPRKCLLPDCNCGGPAIPGGLKRDEVPQVVLLTFDDAVNDLNWELYEEIFNSGRTNPNGCPILGTFYVSHEWTDYGQVQTLYSRGHEFASHTVTHSFGEKFSKSQWHKEVHGQREILHLYGGVKLEDIRGMRAPFLQIGGNRMFEMLHEDNFTYDSSMPVFDNRPPFWPYTLDYNLNHDCMISPCPTKSFPGVWEVGMVMWEDLKGGRCSMADSCSNPADEEGVYEMLTKNFNRHYSSNRAPFGLFYHSAWFNTNHHRRGFLKFLDTILAKKDVYVLTNWQLIQWMRQPTPLSQIKSFKPWSCDSSVDRPASCHHPNVCNVRYQSGTRFMKTCQPCPERYPWVGDQKGH